MITLKKPLIWISSPDGIHNNYGLQIYTEDVSLIERFRKLCYDLFFGSENKWTYQAFWQGNQEDWVYVEFWNSYLPAVESKILNHSITIADALGLTLDIK